MRLYRSILLLATVVAFCVVSLGAYVRLSDAGLGCPDWPGCYGQLLGVPEQPDEQSAARQAFPGKPLQADKAWKEMLHRYLAGSLGLLILAIFVLAWRRRKLLRQSPFLPTLLLAVVCFQAALGMWTVTLLLKPIIVTAHLIGGMTTLALLLWLLLRQSDFRPISTASRGLRFAGLLALLAIIALGGWVSSNYAALACSDFPACQGTWLPAMDFAHAFQFRHELGQTDNGALLSNSALTAIHWTHRVGALIVLVVAGALASALLRSQHGRRWGLLLALALGGQILLGIANVLFSLPLPLAVAHNTGAAILLAITLALNLRLSRH
jgi:cytochrome c oxidase assembly protein subunit 15